jgi:hypothetical protein
MPSSTKWRIYITSTNGSAVTGIAEVEMRASIGGANLCSGGTPSASSAYPAGGPYEAAQAFDSNAATFWDSRYDVPQWIEYDFASTQSIAEILIKAPPSGNVNDAPKDFQLQYWDGSAWIINLMVPSQTGWTAGEVRTFSEPATAKRTWRLYITAVESGVPGVAELAMHTSVGGTNVCTGGTPLASSFYDPSYVASKAFDGSGSTFWDAAAVAPQCLQYAFGSAQNIVEYVVTAPPSGNQANAPKTFKLQYNDGLGGWTDADSRTSEPNWAANEARTYSLGGAGATARPRVFVCT